MFLWMGDMGDAHFSAGLCEEAASWLERSRKIRPDFSQTHRSLAATYAQLGRMEEAQMALRENVRLAPDDSVSRVKEELPYADPDFVERYIGGLRKAGLPE